MYGSHFDVYDLHASYEGAVVKIYRKAAISLFTCETQERPSMMQGCTLLGCSFSLAQRKEPKEASTLTKLDFRSTSVTTRESSSRTCLSSRCSISSPYMGRLNRSSCRSYIKVRSDHQRSGVIFYRLRATSSVTFRGLPFLDKPSEQSSSATGSGGAVNPSTGSGTVGRVVQDRLGALGMCWGRLTGEA